MENGHKNGFSSSSNEGWLPLNEEFSTLAIHSGYTPDDRKGYSAVVPPITLSTTYQLDSPAVNRGFDYSRTSNPCREILEQRLAALEGGAHGVCFASGMSAISALISLLKSGDHVICSDDVYGGTTRRMHDAIERNNLQVETVDLSNIANLKAALKPNTRMVFFETPANPTLRIFDIAAISKAAHDFSKDILVAVDNTVLTSYFQRPLILGADLVHYSLTKYINGHGDTVMGAIITDSDELKTKLNFYQNGFGAVPSPFDCYLVIRGLKTLSLRMDAMMKNSTKVANFLEKHPKVKSVNHPGLKSHPHHSLALKQSSGHSSLMSFTIKEEFSAVKFLDNLKIFCNAASFGGCESLCELPAFFTHIMVPIEQRMKLGIVDNFVRISVGLEGANSLIQDLSQALEKC